MKRIAIYTRVSTVSQSTEQQLFTLRETASRYADSSIVAEYTDTISGATESRKGLDACLLAARQKKFDVLYVYSIDRLGRSTKNLISVVDQLQELKLAVSSGVSDVENYFVGAGCAAHQCTVDEAVFSIDKRTGALVTVLLEDGKTFRFFGVSGAAELPAPLKTWYSEHGGE